MKHIIKVHEHHGKLSLKFSIIPSPVKLHKLKNAKSSLKEIIGNSGCVPQTQISPTFITQWIKHTKLRLNLSLSGKWRKTYSTGLIEDVCPYQISIIVIPGFIQLITYFLTCLCASAASRKSFQISSLAWSSAFFSSLVVLQAAVRLENKGNISNKLL